MSAAFEAPLRTSSRSKVARAASRARVAAAVRDRGLRDRISDTFDGTDLSWAEIGELASPPEDAAVRVVVEQDAGDERADPARRLDLQSAEAQLLEGIRAAAESDAHEPRLAAITTRCPAMQELIETACRVADSSSHLLITGETGVGKEHLARAIHNDGPRANAPFLVVNCGALPESLLESQLFGHARGSFTGADRARRGFFEAAAGGTLLLDEIGELPLHLQVKLLTVLERGEVVPVGECKPVPVDTRVITATNRDLRAEVDAGNFRADLYYRLDVVHLDVPPLRARVDDIPDLAGRAIHELREARPAGDVEGVEPAALEALVSYSWPGNVRELRNAIERALVLGDCRRIRLGDLPAAVRDGEPGEPAKAEARAISLRNSLRQTREAAVAHAERDYLDAALRSTRGTIAKTAKLAGIGTRSLYDKMKRYGLRKEDYREPR